MQGVYCCARVCRERWLEVVERSKAVAEGGELALQAMGRVRTPPSTQPPLPFRHSAMLPYSSGEGGWGSCQLTTRLRHQEASEERASLQRRLETLAEVAFRCAETARQLQVAEVGKGRVPLHSSYIGAQHAAQTLAAGKGFAT